MDSVSDVAALSGVKLHSRKRRGRRKKRCLERQAGNADSVQNVNQANQNVKDSSDDKRFTKTKPKEVDSTIHLTTNHQKFVGVSAVTPLVKHTESGKKKSIKKADGTNVSFGRDHANIMSNLSLLDAPDGMTDDKSKKIMSIPQESGLSAGIEFSTRTFHRVNEHPSIVISSEVSNGALDSVVSPCVSAIRSPFVSSRRKLLILDLNGLLADIVLPPPKDCKSDINIAGRAIFKRPFYYDFVKFCCERFDVGIWSSRSKKIIDLVVDYLLGDLKHKFLFCWNVSQCTETGFRTLENMYKPLVLKELRKLWEKHQPDLPWEKGDYNESNTILLDDSPYKALLNPIHTGIFPYSYFYGDKNDNSLGPRGDFRVYLEGLAMTDNVRKYIEEHPFGQGAIDERSSSWSFYSRVLCSQSVQHAQS